MLSFIKISDLSYSFPDGEKLFENINLNLTSAKAGLIGNNGLGKTTLLKLISGSLKPSAGSINVTGSVVKYEQDQTVFGELDVLEVLGVKGLFTAIKKITAGMGAEDDFLTLDDNWDIEEKTERILSGFGLSHIPHERKVKSLSGGEAGRLMLAACIIKEADFILFDEPTNHLDMEAREFFYETIANYKKGLLVVSHDKKLLRQMNKTIELSAGGIKVYGGNYDFYCVQKQIEKNAIEQKIANTEVILNKTLKTAQKVITSNAIKNSIIVKQRESLGVAKAVINKRRGSAEKTSAHLASVYEKKIDAITGKLDSLKGDAPLNNLLKIDLKKGEKQKRTLVIAEDINYSYGGGNLWINNLTFNIGSGERILIKGNNGSGKTTLLNIILGILKPAAGKIKIFPAAIGVIDQRYEILKRNNTVLENIRRFAPSGMTEHELRIRLGRFTFYKDEVFKTAGNLSGGEKCRLAMACLLAVSNSPGLIFLDEPTNNLDLASIEQMQSAFTHYAGSLVVITHDEDFIQSMRIDKIIDLNEAKVISN